MNFTGDPILADFRNFLYVVWKHLGLPDPTPAQYAIAEYLQYSPRRCVVEAFRGVGKSWMTVAYVLWRLKRDPELKILVVSASKNLADNFTTFCFQLINDMPMLMDLRPSSGQRSSKIQFDVGPAKAAKDPSVRSVGITGQITGGRADIIIPDDIETLNNSLTQSGRDKLSEAIKEFDAVLKPGGEIKFLGTPQTEQSIYQLLPARGYEIRIWPARFPDERWMKRNGQFLAPEIKKKLETKVSLPGAPTDPQRFTDVDLQEREASYGKSGFALQFMLDTSLSDADRYPLKLSDLVVADVNGERAPEDLVWASIPSLAYGDDVPCVGMVGDRYYRPLSVIGQWLPYTGSVLAIDPSGRGNDELGYCVAKTLNGKIYISACGGLSGGYADENLRFLAKLAKEQKVHHCIVESNFGDGMFTQLFTPHLLREWECAIEEVRHNTQKERRIIDTLEPLMNQHRLVIDPKVLKSDYDSGMVYASDKAKTYMLAFQLSRLTRDRGSLRHDDRLDALAIACAYWVTAMAQDVNKKIEEDKNQRLDEELERFMENALGSRPKKQGWI